MSDLLLVDKPVEHDAPATKTPPKKEPQRSSILVKIGNWFTSGGFMTLMFLLPAIIGFTLFGWWPIINGVLLSFQETNFITTEWIGLENFSRVFSDPLIMKAFQNTTYFAVLAIIFGFPVPLIVAGTLSELRRTRQFGTILAFLPVVIPPVVSILLWKRFYAPGPEGMFNTVLGWFGLGPVEWLQNVVTSMPSIVILSIWSGMGSTVIIYLAAITMIDRELYDAAEVDGASIWRRIWHVTLPQLRGTMLILLLLQIIGVFQVFAEPFLLTDGGPENGTITILMLVYRRFLKGDYGGAAALSVIMAVILVILSWIYLRVTKKWGSK